MGRIYRKKSQPLPPSVPHSTPIRRWRGHPRETDPDQAVPAAGEPLTFSVAVGTDRLHLLDHPRSQLSDHDAHATPPARHTLLYSSCLPPLAGDRHRQEQSITEQHPHLTTTNTLHVTTPEEITMDRWTKNGGNARSEYVDQSQCGLDRACPFSNL